ncbi:hypothetical protein NMG60_11020866 [Bertholletia excelsa]
MEKRRVKKKNHSWFNHLFPFMLISNTYYFSAYSSFSIKLCLSLLSFIQSCILFLPKDPFLYCQNSSWFHILKPCFGTLVQISFIDIYGDNFSLTIFGLC